MKETAIDIMYVTNTKKAFDAQLQDHPQLDIADSPVEQILAEISFGADCAANYQFQHPEARSYIHRAIFPMHHFEAITADELKELEKLQIYIFKKEGLLNANITIIYHF